jgi:hypothetical protein
VVRGAFSVSGTVYFGTQLRGDGLPSSRLWWWCDAPLPAFWREHCRGHSHPAKEGAAVRGLECSRGALECFSIKHRRKWLSFPRGHLLASWRAEPRRVVVKARVVRLRGRPFRSGPLPAHVAYLERDGVTRDGEKGRTFGAAEDRADAVAFARRGMSSRRRMPPR